MKNSSGKLEESLYGRVFRSAGISGYQKQAIVSRRIIGKKTGSVTLFAFDSGQGLSEHEAPYDAMIYILEGIILMTISGKHMVVKRGEMIVIPAHSAHSLKAQKRSRMMLVMIRS